MDIKAVLFDLDDTLVIEEAAAEAAFLATCEHARTRYGIEPGSLHKSVRLRARELWYASSTIGYCRTIGISSWEGLWGEFLGEDSNLRELHAWASTYRREAWSHALADHGVRDAEFAGELAIIFGKERRKRHELFPDAEPILNGLRNTHRLGLVTNGAPDLQREKIAGAGLARYFDVIVASGDIGIGKPDTRIFLLALEKLGVQPSMAAMVGDTLLRDIRGAQEAGLKGIWLSRSGEERRENISPDAQIRSLTELRGILDGGVVV
jgi:putative hydrolase of the HAD superfamily